MITFIHLANNNYEKTINLQQDLINKITLKFTEDDINFNVYINIEYRSTIEEEDNVQHDFSLSLSKEMCKNKYVNIILRKQNIIGKAYNDIIGSTCYTHVQGTYKQDSDNANHAILGVFFDDDEIIVQNKLSLNKDDIILDGDYNIIQTPSNFKGQYISYYSKNFANSEIAFKKKRNNIGNYIDINDSASYLENEIDILYKIIEILISKLGIDIGEDYKNIIQQISHLNILSYKTPEKILDEILTNKTAVRKTLNNYYEVKEKRD